MRYKYLLAIPLVGFIVLGVTNITTHNQRLELKQIQSKDTGVQLKQLEQRYDTQLKSNTVNEQELKKLQEEKKKLEEQLQARAAEKERIAKLQTTQKVYAATAAPVQPIANIGPVAGCTGNADADWIYMKESGCNPNSVNSIGCRGIGQACPGSKLPCGAEIACQHAFFSSYAIGRYGSWAAARAFWEKAHWW